MPELTIPRTIRVAPLGREARQLMGSETVGDLADAVEKLETIEMQKALIELAVRLGGLEAELVARGIRFSDPTRARGGA